MKKPSNTPHQKARRLPDCSRQIVIVLFGCIAVYFVSLVLGSPGGGPEPPPEEEQVVTGVQDVLPDGPEPEPSVEEPPEPDIELYAPYEFGTPLEESEPVDGAWFDRAAFLGDSRTEGLQLFSGLVHGDYFWNRGLSVFKADDEENKLFEVDGEQVTMLGTLRGKTYDAVYVMLGINDLGHLPEDYGWAMSALVDGIEEAQPGAVIYLQTLPPVNDEAVRQNELSEDIRNEMVSAFNEAIVRVAAEKRVVLLDVAPLYRGEDGQLPAEMTSDGVHFIFEGYVMWADYLRSHVMDPGRYFFYKDNPA